MKKICFFFIVSMLSSCINSNDRVLSAGSQVATRSYQSRVFDTVDDVFVMRGIVSTMQDLGFVLEKSDMTLGTISGTLNGRVKMSVSIRSQGTKQILVRVNAQDGMNAIEEPIAYQNFFNSLSQSLFLDANMVE